MGSSPSKHHPNNTEPAPPTRLHSSLSLTNNDDNPSIHVRRLPSLRYLKKRRASISTESGKTASPKHLPVYPKLPAVTVRIRTIIQDITFFKELNDQERERLVEAMQERRVRPGEVVIREGEQGDYFFALDQGRFIVTKEGQVKFCYEGSGSFGELALLYNSPRAATVTAETEGVLWALDRASFRSLVINSMIQRRKRNETVLRKNPLFKDLDEYQMAAIADCLAPLSFEADSVIIRQGDPITSSSKFYIVEEGQVECIKTMNNSITDTLKENKTKVITRFIGPNDVFGEIALLTRQPRQADCIAATPVKCLAMSRDAFERLMGPVESLFSRQISLYKSMNDEQRRMTGP